MSRITSAEITKYLEQFGWKYNLAADATIVTAYGCEIPHYYYHIPIAISTTQYWVTIRGVLQGRASRSRELLALMNELNAQAHSVRFLLIKESAIVQAEIPVSRCDIFHFREALTAVCHYATRYGLEVSVLASAKSVARLFSRVLDSESISYLSTTDPAEEDWQLNLYARSNRLQDEAPDDTSIEPRET